MEIKTKLLFFYYVFPNILSGEFPSVSEPQIRQATKQHWNWKGKKGLEKYLFRFTLAKTSDIVFFHRILPDSIVL